MFSRFFRRPTPKTRQEPVVEWDRPPLEPDHHLEALRLIAEHHRRIKEERERPPPPYVPSGPPLTIEEAEAEIGGLANHKPWQEIKATMQPGDALHRFHSPDWTWKALCGRAGIELVRDGQVIRQIITMLN